jgi:outer membrane usher protein
MSFKRCASLSVLLIFALFHPPAVEGSQMAFLRILLNQEQKGEFLVCITELGDFLVRSEDLKTMGFSEVKGRGSIIEGEEYISLSSMEGVEAEVDEKTLTLEVTADPKILAGNVLTLRYPRQLDVYYPKDTAAFLNYAVTYYGSDSFAYDRIVVTDQLGFRTGDFLFLTDSSYIKREGEKGDMVRLLSNVTYDRREDLTRGVAGDFFAASGELGSTVNLGGLGFSKNYLIDPYFITYPEIGFSGATSLPSEVEVYRDGILIRRDRISPGSFELRDIPTYAGSGLVKVVIKDAFGREQIIELPYYFTNTLLKKGLHEYSYDVGFQRENFGVASNEYNGLAFLGFHRYGMNDSLTAGIRGEASGDVVNAGLNATYLLPRNVGVVNGSLAWSDSRERGSGFGGSLSYLYQSRSLSFNLLLREFTREYSNISLEKTFERVKYETSVGARYYSRLLGSLSVGFSAVQRYNGPDRKLFTSSYSRRLTNRSNITALFRMELESGINEFAIGFTYYFKRRITASAAYRSANGTSRERVQVLKNLPLGEGFGGRASFERDNGVSETFNNYNLQLQYNGRYAQFTGEILEVGDADFYSLSAAGGLSLVKDVFSVSRPIEDSFAVVDVGGDLNGVRVYLNNQEMGRTGASGKVLIPTLSSYYDNQISISDRDIPIEYAITDVMKYVSPPLRSGSYIEFMASKMQAFVGTLKIAVDGKIRPVEFIDFKLTVDGKDLFSYTGRGGEFYLENIAPGKYEGQFKLLDKVFAFDIVFPESDDMLVDLGEVLCE